MPGANAPYGEFSHGLLDKRVEDGGLGSMKSSRRIARRSMALLASTSSLTVASFLVVHAPAAVALGPCGTNGMFASTPSTTTVQGTNSCKYTMVGADTFTVPSAGVSTVGVAVVGGGGGGSSDGAFANGPADGGGGGGYCCTRCPSRPMTWRACMSVKAERGMVKVAAVEQAAASTLVQPISSLPAEAAVRRAGVETVVAPAKPVRTTMAAVTPVLRAAGIQEILPTMGMADLQGFRRQDVQAATKTQQMVEAVTAEPEELAMRIPSAALASGPELAAPAANSAVAAAAVTVAGAAAMNLGAAEAEARDLPGPYFCQPSTAA